MKKLINYTTNLLNELLETPSPTGYTGEVMKLLDSELRSLNIVPQYTNKGALYGKLPGDREDSIAFSAHVDTLGAMVKEILPNGRIKIQAIGSYSLNTIEGENLTVHTRNNGTYSGAFMLNKSSIHVHPDEVKKGERNEDSLSLLLDEEVKTAEAVRDLGIEVGDFISIDPRVVHTRSGYIKSRHLDDKAGVVCILALLKYLVEEEITDRPTIYFFISNYEEVGHGASYIPFETDCFVAVDMAAVDEGQNSIETATTVCAMDSSGAYDFELSNELVSIAEEHKIDYQVDVYPHYGSDGSTALRGGNDFKVALIGPGVAHSHTYERTHIDGIVNTIKLMLAFVEAQ